MKQLLKWLACLFAVAFGIAFGLWFAGSTRWTEVKANGIDLAQLSADDVVKAMEQNPKAMTSETFVSFWGLGNFVVPGGWISWIPILGFPILFLALTLKWLNRRQAR